MMKYIKADELIQFCSSMLVETKDDLIIQTHNNCFRRMREYIKSLPSANVIEVKHGEWNLQEINEDHEYEWFCSECKKRNDVKTNFCPNCGADMRGKVNERKK